MHVSSRRTRACPESRTDSSRRGGEDSAWCFIPVAYTDSSAPCTSGRDQHLGLFVVNNGYSGSLDFGLALHLMERWFPYDAAKLTSLRGARERAVAWRVRTDWQVKQ